MERLRERSVPEGTGGVAVGSYAERAMLEAGEAGLTPRELDALLRGRRVTDMIPPEPDEDLTGYANRATSELFILYLAEGVGEVPSL